MKHIKALRPPYLNRGVFIVTHNNGGRFWLYEGGMTETDNQGYAIGTTLNLRIPDVYFLEWRNIPAQEQKNMIDAFRLHIGCTETVARRFLSPNVGMPKTMFTIRRVENDKRYGNV